ncbi:helix-turn-helix transcriptional regulator [Paenibacillus sp. IB182496]|uniref:Helix-turn-helix transcriptional regulator n=1 Tax=Paenibacillus sabuli TaxID=2772509 RepID=A0A927BUL5_9BACL|nr:AraC family transcriptional regulator [Paenibacillus sabuli]MBD2847123.1 helix-turn-helix transcriptional regulator [Paenibacillus sabuli]
MTKRDSQQAGRLFHFDNYFERGEAVYGMVELVQIGEIACERGYEIAPHEQSCMELSCIVSGSGTVRVGDEELAVRAGDLVFNNAGHAHAITASDADMLRFIYMGFHFTALADRTFAAMRTHFLSAPYHIARDAPSLLQPFQRNIDEFYARRPYSAAMIRGYCEEVLISAYRAFTGGGDPVARYAAGRAPHSAGHTVYAVIRHIERHLESLGSIRSIAETLNYDATYLSHVFKARTGMTVQRYIHHKKIEKALELLSRGSLTVSEVAERLGYESLQSFSKAFSRAMGYPPSQHAIRESLPDNE